MTGVVVVVVVVVVVATAVVATAVAVALMSAILPIPEAPGYAPKTLPTSMIYGPH